MKTTSAYQASGQGKGQKIIHLLTRPKGEPQVMILLTITEGQYFKSV